MDIRYRKQKTVGGMPKKKTVVWMKGSMTVEAALLCPFLCLVLCSMLMFTLRLYNTVDAYTEQITKRWDWSLTAPDSIRLEAVTEDFF